MQQFIDQMLERNFEYENIALEFSSAKIEISIPAGELFEGSFRVRSTPGALTEGYISTTDFRMECLTTSFSGSDEEITFCFHGESMEAGDVVKGVFHIISNHGEYNLPFIVSVEHTILKSSIGPIKNLFHFANLAKSNWQEAVKLFYSPQFQSVFTTSDASIYDSYRGLCVYPGNEQNVEEFLIRINKKQAVEFLVEEKEIFVELSSDENAYEVLERELDILKNGWGYTALNVECDGEFLFTEKEFLTYDDFLGNRCKLPIYIEHNLCRVGKNFGQVVLYNSHVCLTVPVTVKVGRTVHEAAGEKHTLMRLMKLYQSFRLKKMSSANWLKESGKLVEQMAARNENDIPVRLFQAQLLISEERYNEAQWLLDHALSYMEQNEMEESVLWAYYLYLTTLMHREENYTKQVSKEVREIYRKKPTQWRLAWLLLYLSEEYSKTASEKWNLLEKQFYHGCSSPILYMEAMILLNGNSSLLRSLDKFELQVLYYGAKHQMFNWEVVEQILYLAGRLKDYSPVFFKVLVSLYEKKADTRVLQEICTQLIKGGRRGHKFFKWYEKGMEAQLRITNLYEYYMMSLDLSVDRKLPKRVLMYFSYQNHLDYEHTAYLYQYILQHRNEYAEIYAGYKLRMEYFVVERIQKQQINRNLAFLYQEILTQEMVTEEIAHGLSRLLFAHQIQVKDTRLKKVIVYHRGNLQAREYTLQDGKTWVSLYGNNYTILFEDRFGNRFAKSVEYTLEQLMVPGKFLRMIIPYQSKCMELDQYLYETLQQEITPRILPGMLRVAAAEEIVSEIKTDIYLKLLQYYYDGDYMDELDEYLETIPFEQIDAKERGTVLKFMVLRGKYATAYHWLEKYGPYFADTKTLMRLCGDRILQNDMVENPVLKETALHVFRKGKQDKTLLSYLVRYFTGSTKEMRDIWKAARNMGIDCLEFSEKIICQMLYSGAFVGEKMDIFSYYVSCGAKPEVENAFLTRCAYDYFVKEKLTGHSVFQQLQSVYIRDGEVGIVCKLAFLKYYAEHPYEMTEEDMPLIEVFLEELLNRGICLNFFRDLKKFKYLTREMNDKTIVEYRARPGGRAHIHYIVVNEYGEAEEYMTEYMTEVYGGVCFKEFVLFFGETLQYYITEDWDGEEELTESGTIQKGDIESEEHTNRYELVNDMMIAKTLQDYDTMDGLLEEYCYKEYWNSRMFQLQ